jgi:hypothetical protein
LWVRDPWAVLGRRLNRNPTDLEQVIKRTTDRRNDIVHRADRSEKDPEGAIQPISLAFAQQAVDTIKHVCMALDELVEEQMAEFRAEIERRAQEAEPFPSREIPDAEIEEFIQRENQRAEEEAPLVEAGLDELMNSELAALFARVQQLVNTNIQTAIDPRVLGHFMANRLSSQAAQWAAQAFAPELGNRANG